MRGRLIDPFSIELRQLDTAQTEAAGSYDPNFRTVVPKYVDGQRVAGSRYKDPIRLLAQVEVASHKAQQQTASGDAPTSRYSLVIHFKELEARALLDAKGEPVLRVNDTLVAIYTTRGELVQTFDPALYVTEVQTTGFGLGRRRNLCILTVSDRAKAVRG